MAPPDKQENITAESLHPGTIHHHPIAHNYTQFEKTVLQWAVSFSALFSTLPFSWLCTHVGAKYVFFFSGLSSSVATAITPMAADLGFSWFVLTRVIQGLAYACDFAIVGILCTNWASLREQAIFVGVLTCFSPLASSLTNFFSGMICESYLGWPWIYYFHGIISSFLFLLWAIFYTDDPAKNRFVSANEIQMIHFDKTEAHKHREPFVPYLAILKDRVVWAVWLNAFADLFSAFFILIYGPTYIRRVLQYTLTETGVLGSIVTMAHIPIKIGCAFASDSIRRFKERNKMIFFNSVAVIAPALIYIFISFASTMRPIITILLFGGIQALIGFNCGGFYKCGALVSRQYAEFVIAFTQLIKCVVFFVAPALVTIFVHDETNGLQWSVIFWIMAISLILANTIFCFYATDKPRPFTEITRQIKLRKNIP